MKHIKSYSELIYLIREYKAGSLTDAEQDVLKAWLNSAEENQKFFDKIMRTDEWTEVEKMSMFAKSEKLPKSVGSIRKKKSGGRFYFSRPLQYVAALFIFVLSFLFHPPHEGREGRIVSQKTEDKAEGEEILFINANGETEILENKDVPIKLTQFFNNEELEKVLPNESEKKPVLEEKETTFSSIVTPKGKKVQFYLEDGTFVFLNEQSELSFASEIADEENRLVKLSGEAYFKVSHNGKPFMVESEGKVVKVLGTAFNVSSYKKDQLHHIDLLEGKIEVDFLGIDEKEILSPGQRVEFDKGEDAYRIKSVPIHKMALWRENTLFFDQDDIHYITQLLSRKFDVQFHFNENPPKSLFSGEIPGSEGVGSVLEKLELTGKVKFKKINEDKYEVF